VKILVLFYDSAIGGGQKAITQLADILEQHHTIKRVSIKQIDSSKITWLGKNRLLFSARALMKAYNKEQAQVIFTTLYGCGLLALILRICTLGKVKYVYREATNIALGLSRLQRLLTYFIIKLSDVTIFNSQEQKKDQERFHHNLCFVPNINKTAKLTRKRNRGIVMVGRCVEMKNFERGIDLLQQLEQYKLLVYTTNTNSNYLDLLRKHAMDNGVLNRLEIHLNETDKDVMYSNEILYIASDFEGSPNILFEALSRGVPVLSEPIKYGIKEFVDNETTGVILSMSSKPYDISQIIRKLREVDAQRIQKQFQNMNLLETSTLNLNDIFHDN